MAAEPLPADAPPPVDAPRITRDLFYSWGKTCTVRQIQKKFEDMVEAARGNNRSVIAEMAAQGYKDYAAFERSCPQFPLTCWPSELGELGSGVVLYFHFLTLLALVVLFCGLLQIPALAVYGQQNHLELWQWTFWRDTYSDVDPGTSFEHTVLGKSRAIAPSLLTPGNFGPRQATNTFIPALYVVCVVVICVAALVGYQRMVMTDISVDIATTSPNDFAVMVRGLPHTATDEQDITQWFSENAVVGKTVDIVKVVIGWDVVEFRENLRQLRECRRQLEGLEKDDPQAVAIRKTMAEASAALSSAAPDRASKLRSSGIVVVIFRHQAEMRACLQRWNGPWAWLCYEDASEAPYLWTGNRLGRGGPLPRYPLGGEPVCRIRVERAPNPGDINWMELGVERRERLKRLAKTHAAMGLVVLVTFFAVYGLQKLSLWAAHERDRRMGSDARYGFQVLSLLPAILVVFMNVFLVVVARVLGQAEYHETRTEEQFSQAAKMSVGMILNTAGVLLFLNAQPKEWYRTSGLIDNLGTMLLLNSLLPPCLPLLDFKYRLNYLKRRKLTEQQLEEMNDVIARVGPTPKTAEEARDLQRVRGVIEGWKQRAFAPSEMNAPRRFADALKTTFCCVFFMPLMPVVSGIGLLGIGLQYAVDKYALLRVYRRPERPANSSMALSSMIVLKNVAPLALVIATFVFLTPSWKDKHAVSSSCITALLVALMTMSVPLSLCGRALYRMHGAKAAGELDYYRAQFMWAKEMKYHKDHFLYAKLPDSVNPEYFQPGARAAVKLQDVKATYGAATAQAAAATAAGPSSRAEALPGGCVLPRFGVSTDGVAVQADSAHPVLGVPPAPPIVPEDAPASAPAPGLLGSIRASSSGDAAAPLAPKPAAALTPPTQAQAPPTTAPPRASGAAHPFAPPARFVWEFATRGDRWHEFDADCQELLEKSFGEHRSGRGPVRLSVTTKGIRLAVDFTAMTQTKVDSGRVSQIRRREDSAPRSARAPCSGPPHAAR